MDNYKKSIVESEYPKMVITQSTIENIKKQSAFYTSCPIRMQMGKIYTNEEFNERSDRILGTEMPNRKKNVFQRILRPKRK